MRRYQSIMLLAGLVGGCSGNEESSFDLAYPSEWTFSVAGPVSGYLVVVNTGSDPMQLDGLHVDSVTDDHEQAVVQIELKGFAPRTLDPGRASGFLTPLSKTVLVDSGLVPEPRLDDASDYLSIGLLDAPEGTYDVHADVKLSLAHQQVTIPLTIHMVPGPVIYADPAGGKRMSFSRARSL